ncbi:hypothetical protein NQ314_011236 [Rhamnusium bicolor]|uniref:CCHC-type domain-containing protein n=1 Tax=Rhamnusium bicolor TaxID=1586634 RepID=A0AAV8XJS5_9CUCU|nr:hypothetical protein NQ314_011236 [Rhamnusium bicolor]
MKDDKDVEIKTRKVGLEADAETIHIRGLDAVTGKAEVIEALEEKIGSLKGKMYRLGDLRESVMGTQAVTLTINKDDANKISEDREIRVGLVNCSMERRIPMTRCLKCWAFDHLAVECDGPDRTKTCFRCGNEGHAAKDCTNEEGCPICKKPGHKAGTGKCGAFRRTLSTARKNKCCSKCVKPGHATKECNETGVQQPIH